MIIRPYRPADDRVLIAIEYRSPRGASAPFVHYRRCFADRAAMFPNHALFVLEIEQHIAGCVGIAIKDVQIGGAPFALGYLFDLRVDPGFRRQGYGALLLDYAEDYLAQRGALGVYGDIVTVNLPSLRLFEQHGYQRIRQLLYLEYQPASFWTPNVMVESDDGDDQVRFTTVVDRDFFVEGITGQVAPYDYRRWFHDSDSGYASLSAFELSRVYRQVSFDDLSLPETVLQQQSRSLRLFHLIGVEQPELMAAVFDTVRDQALANNYYSLTTVIDAEETLPGFFFEQAGKQKRYWMLFKSLHPDFDPEWGSPFYVDAREI